MLVDASAAMDGGQAQQGTFDLVEVLKASWSDRRKAAANTGVVRQKALEVSNVFSESEGASRRMIYHGLDHFAVMSLLAPPTPTLAAPINTDVIGLLTTRFHQHRCWPLLLQSMGPFRRMSSSRSLQSKRESFPNERGSVPMGAWPSAHRAAS